MPSGPILFATDYSAGSAQTLAVATSMARQHDATLLIAHVSPYEKYPVGELFDEEPVPDKAELKKLHAVVPPDPHVKFEHRLVYGPPGEVERVKPADEILKLAGEVAAQAIVVGSHGASGLTELLMGRVAESVSRRATCPVIVVRHPGT
ncbi:MAG TPA: universal stress protein [Pirellulales bacterium]|jgi:nucleotide-binding universal stress UspA family protein|nr:universal stress protein [Pirellulales bacterium]